MKKTFAILAVPFLFASQPVFAAQNYAKNFSGIAATVGLGLAAAQSRISVLDDAHGGADTSDDLGENYHTLTLGLSALKEVSDNFLLGGGISYDANGSRTGKSRTFLGSDFYTTTKIKNHFSVYVQPTYSINESTAFFAKVGYHNARVSINDINGQVFFNGLSYGNNVSGVGYGIGLMTMLNKNLFLKIELEKVDYNRINIPFEAGHVTTYSLSTSSGIFSVGYKF